MLHDKIYTPDEKGILRNKKTRNERSRQNRTKAAMAVLLRIRPVRAKPLKQNTIRNARKKALVTTVL